MMEENQRLYSEILDIWKKFCSRIGFNINVYRKSNITNGGATKTLFIEAVDKGENYKLFQTFNQRDFWLEFIDWPNKLNCIYESSVSRDIELSIWEKDFFERIFKSNRIHSGNSLFDSAFSGYSNDKEFMNKVFQDYEIQNILLKERLLILNVKTENSILRISLKNMHDAYYTVEELEHNYKKFKYIVERVLKFI